MDFWMSLLVYNPIEAMAIIYSADLFTGRKKKWTDIIHFYIFGLINLLLQYLQQLCGSISSTILISLLTVSLLSFVFIYYYSKVLKTKYNTKILFTIRCWSYFSTIIFIVFINLTGTNFYSFMYASGINEFITVVSIKFFMFGVVFMIKFIEKIFKNRYNKAFTDFGAYQPKFPKLLKK